MGTPITVCSTGMGGPQVAIAMEELGNLGADTFIRLARRGLGPSDRVGDIVVATASQGRSTADEYFKGLPCSGRFCGYSHAG